jgi:hypothetical protein
MADSVSLAADLKTLLNAIKSLPYSTQKVSFILHCRKNDLRYLWQENSGTLKYMALVAQDILAIPGVSISVERLFSSLKHTLSDSRASITADTVSVDVVCKEWLKSGLAEGVNYTDYIRIHEE